MQTRARCAGALLWRQLNNRASAAPGPPAIVKLHLGFPPTPIHAPSPPSGADPERVKREIEEVVGLDCSNAILASAKQVGTPGCVQLQASARPWRDGWLRTAWPLRLRQARH